MENKTIGARILEIVARDPALAALSRKQLAESFGITYEAFRKWVAGTGSPSKRNELRVAEVLKVPPETFAYGVQYEHDDSGTGRMQESNAGGQNARPVARPVSRNSVTVEPPSRLTAVNWRGGVMVSAHKRFVVVAPDDSMEPIILEGARVILDRTFTPRNKDVVLVEDSSGEWYLRSYRQGPNGRWEAKPENGDFPLMDSERDSLTILAVFDGTQGRRG